MGVPPYGAARRFARLRPIRRLDVRGHPWPPRAGLPGPERARSPDGLVNDGFFCGGGEVRCLPDGILNGSH
jgi:hypothetical protein